MLNQWIVRDELSSCLQAGRPLSSVAGRKPLARLIADFDFQSEDLQHGATAETYAASIEALAVDAREALYEEIFDQVVAGSLDARSLLAFVVFEPHRRLVARAVQDFLTRRHCVVVDEFAGVREVMSILADPNTANRGAVLAGLVLLCDRRINAIARTARGLLSASDIRDFSRVQMTTVQRCTVEFCLEWLIELTQHYTRGPVEDLACALMLMAVHDEQGVVEDEAEINYLVGFNCTRVRKYENFESYYEEVLPIFNYLRGFDGFETPIAAVVDCWEAHKIEACRLRSAAAA